MSAADDIIAKYGAGEDVDDARLNEARSAVSSIEWWEAVANRCRIMKARTLKECLGSRGDAVPIGKKLDAIITLLAMGK